MLELIETYQLDIMLVLCAVCATMAGLLLVTGFLSRRRKWILILMELIATFLLWFDRLAYIYKGDVSQTGYIMVRVSNFMVFFLTSAVVLGFNLYLMDLLVREAGLNRIPLRLHAVNLGAATGMGLVIISQFTGLYYTFDDQNNYQRGPGFLICYIIPVLFPIIQFTVIYQYRKAFSKLIYLSLVLYIFVPIAVGVIQIFTYGVSIVNMAMVLVSVSLYIFTYLDLNREVARAHQIEVINLQEQQQSMKRLFNQTVRAFVRAVEKRAPFSEGHSVRVADYARQIAETSGKNKEECDEVYYSALLHDVGMMGLPDALIGKVDGLTEEERRQKEKKPVLGAEILSSITEYPYLSQSIRYSHERYDGTGYPEGRKGEEIPEISRIIAIANAYETMTSMNISHTPLSYQVVREEFVKQSGKRYDPHYTEIMIQIMDDEHEAEEHQQTRPVETDLACSTYRSQISGGIQILEEITRIRFRCTPSDKNARFSAPSIILFDSYDKHVHDDSKTIAAYRYLEYGEIWFDGHSVSTNARNTSVQVTQKEGTGEPDVYEVIAGRYEDHLSLRLSSPTHTVEAILALPDNSKAAYIALTGENCRISDIQIKNTGERTKAGSIRQIVSKISYIDRLESDLPNVQVDYPCSAATEGIPIRDEVIVDFHTMSLPSANLVWHCPYIVLFFSEDQKVGGEGYREYALIKLNGESTGSNRYAGNQFKMKKTDDFPGWDVWKKKHKEGLECSVRLLRKGSKVQLSTETLGISIESTTVVYESPDMIYAALTGDEVALTDIRIR